MGAPAKPTVNVDPQISYFKEGRVHLIGAGPVTSRGLYFSKHCPCRLVLPVCRSSTSPSPHTRTREEARRRDQRSNLHLERADHREPLGLGLPCVSACFSGCPSSPLQTQILTQFPVPAPPPQFSTPARLPVPAPTPPPTQFSLGPSPNTGNNSGHSTD